MIKLENIAQQAFMDFALKKIEVQSGDSFLQSIFNPVFMKTIKEMAK